MITKKQLLSLDYILVILVFALAVFGITIIGSARRINIYGPNGQYLDQMIWFGTGIILMIITLLVDYKTICKFYIFIYIINITLLILVLIIGSGDNVSRWLFGLQPSEFSKIFMIIYLSKFIDKKREKINNINVLLFIFVITLIPAILIKIQPSLSASLVILAILVIELFAGKLNYKYILILLIIAVPITTIIVIDLLSENQFILSKFLEPYHIKRLLSAIKPDLSDPLYYQTKNSIWAIGSGQLQGKGLYNGTINQLSYLPESHTDFIFSVIGEEFGFIGCIGVLTVMLLIIIKCLMIASKASDNVGMLIVTGIAGMFAFQTFVNVGVATGLLPNTGMPFPFVSYGGSSMWVNMIAIGLVLNIGMRKPKSMFEG